ncbi:MAG TPA: hypothetical protein PKY22_08375 [Accumulibacter sp.]|nr:hypothetical protein [Accumulibacter sp.]
MTARARDWSGIGNAFLNLLLVFAVVLLQSWVADGIKGDALFPWLSGGALQHDKPGFVPLMAGMILLAVFFSFLLYRRRRMFLPTRISRIGNPGQVQPRRMLVLTLSWPGWDWQPQQLERQGRSAYPLPSDLSGALQAMAALGAREKFTWEQLLRAVEPHADCLQEIVLIGSEGAQGTFGEADRCRQMLRHYYRQLPDIDMPVHAVDYESLDSLSSLYRQIIGESKQPANQIMIDVTGGTKVVSIAAAMVCLEQPEIEFQYVETAGAKRVRTFNVVFSAGGRDAQ